MPATLTPKRLLASRFVDLLVGPHGIDRYLELLDPRLSLHDARAEVVRVCRQTERSVTLTLAPNAAWRGFRAGQFVPVGVEIDGVRRTRTYSPAGSEHSGGRELELTVTSHPRGLVSRHLNEHAAPGMIVHLGAAAGEFVLPRPRPRRLALISGGSGITPVLSMLRTLCEEGHDGEVLFVHYGRRRADWLYEPEVRRLAREHPNVAVDYLATREGAEHISADFLASRLTAGGLRDSHVAVCGPPGLLAAVGEIYRDTPERVLQETFGAPSPPQPASRPGRRPTLGTPPERCARGSGADCEGAAVGTVRFLRSGASVAAGTGSLLEQAEAAGLAPAFGCRMGICRTCTSRKASGVVRNLLSGELSTEDDEDIQICVSAPAGDVALEL